MKDTTKTLGIKMKPKRRHLAMACIAIALGAGSAVHAQAEWPSKPIRLVVPFAAGISPDVVARVLGRDLSTALGQPVVIDNKPGAAGIIGAKDAASSAPDGYTVFMSVNSIMGINPHIYSDLPYDPIGDFSPITQVASVPYLLVTTSPKFSSMQDLIDLAKAAPGSIEYSSVGVGSGPHIVMEMFANSAEIEMMHVPYRSSVIPDLLAGIVPVTFEPATTAIPLVRSGKVRALGVTSPKRISNSPDVPAIAEVLPGYDGDGWQGLYVPAGTPPQIVSRLHSEIVKILNKPDVQAQFLELGLVAVGNTPQEFAQVTKDDLKKWGAIVERNGIRAE